MPGAVPRTSTYALTNATIKYVRHARRPRPREGASQAIPHIVSGINTYKGTVPHPAVAEALGVEARRRSAPRPAEFPQAISCAAGRASAARISGTIAAWGQVDSHDMLAVHARSAAEFERQALVHLDALYGAAYRLTRNPRDAEDLVQDALLRAYRFWDSFEQDSNCKAWLLRIVTNTFINEYQRKKRSARGARRRDGRARRHRRRARPRRRERHASRPERALLDRSVSDDVQRALDALPDDFRTAVVLCDVQGLSYKEIAEIMQTPVGTVMSRLFRGRKLLAAALREFAVAEGYVRDETKANDETADERTRRSTSRSTAPQKAREGSQ